MFDNFTGKARLEPWAKVLLCVIAVGLLSITVPTHFTATEEIKSDIDSTIVGENTEINKVTLCDHDNEILYQYETVDNIKVEYKNDELIVYVPSINCDCCN